MAFTTTSKRRNGFPSETNVKRGTRIVHGDKELIEKLGRNDPCPCGSQKSFQKVLHAKRSVSTARSAIIINGSNTPGLWPNGEAADFYSAQCRFDSCRTHQYHTPLAQRIERRASNAEVGGLNPSWRASFPSHPICLKNANRIRRRTHCQRVRLVSSSLVRLVIDLAYAAVRERRI